MLAKHYIKSSTALHTPHIKNASVVASWLRRVSVQVTSQPPSQSSSTRHWRWVDALRWRHFRRVLIACNNMCNSIHPPTRVAGTKINPKNNPERRGNWKGETIIFTKRERVSLFYQKENDYIECTQNESLPLIRPTFHTCHHVWQIFDTCPASPVTLQ